MSNKCRENEALIWINENTIKDRIRNESIHKKLEITLVEDDKVAWDGLGMCNEDAFSAVVFKLERVMEW